MWVRNLALPLLAMGFWVSHCIYLMLSFYICKVGIIIHMLSLVLKVYN